MKLPKTFTIRVTKKHFDAIPKNGDGITDCLVAQVLKEKFKNQFVNMAVNTTCIKDDYANYNIYICEEAHKLSTTYEIKETRDLLPMTLKFVKYGDDYPLPINKGYVHLVNSYSS